MQCTVVVVHQHTFYNLYTLVMLPLRHAALFLPPSFRPAGLLLQATPHPLFFFTSACHWQWCNTVPSIVHLHVLFIPLHFSELPMLSKTLFWLNTSCRTPIRMVVVCQMVPGELTWELTDGLAHIVFPDILREMSQALHVSCSLRCLLAVLSAVTLFGVVASQSLVNKHDLVADIHYLMLIITQTC